MDEGDRICSVKLLEARLMLIEGMIVMGDAAATPALEAVASAATALAAEMRRSPTPTKPGRPLPLWLRWRTVLQLWVWRHALLPTTRSR